MFDDFVKPILIIIAVAMLVWILFWAIVNNSKKKYGKKITPKAELILFAFYIYIVSVLTLTVIPLPFMRFEVSAGGINLVPVMNTIQSFKNASVHHKELPEHTLQNLIGNIIMFIPLGIFLPILAYRYRTLPHVIFLAFICSVSIETTQFIESFFRIYRYVDIDDVILNTTGAILGFILMNNLVLKKDKRPGRNLYNW
jgi:glycopeptide antibiotics resistance protein